ncbi:hypothetical protein V6N00_12565 [Tersicoccus sp. MR15.9]|uniref:hypothetical protein n=1 Tax=Tersicoccus mangrovi TaxID=3121635 RepID=UPI002FE5D883
MAFRSPFTTETDDQERARLAAAPEGSTNHELSGLPVLNPHPARAQVLELPRPYDGHRMVVMPLEFSPGATTGADWWNTAPEDRPLRRHDGSWYCIVLASTHKAYPVGGHDLAISVSELRRARPVDLLATSIPQPHQS